MKLKNTGLSPLTFFRGAGIKPLYITPGEVKKVETDVFENHRGFQTCLSDGTLAPVEEPAAEEPAAEEPAAEEPAAEEPAAESLADINPTPNKADKNPLKVSK